MTSVSSGGVEKLDGVGRLNRSRSQRSTTTTSSSTSNSKNNSPVSAAAPAPGNHNNKSNGTTTTTAGVVGRKRKRIGGSGPSNSKSRLSQQKIFTVEKILRKRIKSQKTEYLIKWQGYSSEHNTWEPKSNLLRGGEALIEEFEKKRVSAQEVAVDSGFKPVQKTRDGVYDIIPPTNTNNTTNTQKSPTAAPGQPTSTTSTTTTELSNQDQLNGEQQQEKGKENKGGSEEIERNGFEKGFEFYKILAVKKPPPTSKYQKPFYFVQFKDSPRIEILPGSLISCFEPHAVIDFLESHIKYVDSKPMDQITKDIANANPNGNPNGVNEVVDKMESEEKNHI